MHLFACVTLMAILLVVTPTDGLLCALCQNSGGSVLPTGLHTGVKHSWHRKAGSTQQAACTQEAPEHLLCQFLFLVLPPSLDISSFCHTGILSHLSLAARRAAWHSGLSGRQVASHHLESSFKPRLLFQVCASSWPCQRPPGALAEPAAQEKLQALCSANYAAFPVNLIV